MSNAVYILGNVKKVLAEIPDGSIDLVLTSPPFLQLRSYLPPGHPDKADEIGAEPTPSLFVDTMLGLSAEYRRVLAPHGSIAVELGDTYAGSGGGWWRLPAWWPQGRPTGLRSRRSGRARGSDARIERGALAGQERPPR